MFLTMSCLANHLEQEYENTKQDPLNALPNELILKIFSYFDFSTLGKCCLVSRQWNHLSRDDTLWKKMEVYTKTAISNKKWGQWFGEEMVEGEDCDEEWSS